jgi:general secretion pathway protein I
MRNPGPPIKNPEQSAGFTLIEVLVALTVIALALSAIIRATGVMTANSAHLKEKTYAHWIAMNRVTELRVTKAWPAVGNSSDDVKMFGEEWRWMQKVSQLAFSEHMRQVEISVIHHDGDENYPLTKLTAFLIEPSLVSQTNPATLWAQGANNPNPGPAGNPDPNNMNGSGNPGGGNGAEGSGQ